MTREFTSEAIVRSALGLLGRPYTDDWRCIQFVREVYISVGLTVPPLAYNLTKEDLARPPAGHVLYLIRPSQIERKRWSHVGIVLPQCRLIHASQQHGMVVIEPIKQVLERYELPTP